MRRILVTGALGQIGSELALRERYGAQRVVASDLGIAPAQRSLADGIYDHLDCTQPPQQICEVMRRHDLVQSMIASGSENAMSDSVDKVIELPEILGGRSGGGCQAHLVVHARPTHRRDDRAGCANQGRKD